MEIRKKIGIMGGTFNPIHQGHLLLAQEAKTFCELDNILFMPSGHSYMKDTHEIADNSMRFEMTRLAIEDNPDFKLSAMEMERKGATYTCDTLATLKAQHPECEYYFILGADNLFSIEKWRNPQKIFHNCKLIAAVRGDKDADDIRKKADELTQKFGADITLLPQRIIDISSSEIRMRISEEKSVRYMVPEKVYSYIQKHKLYQNNYHT